jgi:hypothetical protein
MNLVDVIPAPFDVIPGLTRDLPMVASLQDPRFRGDDIKVFEEKTWLTG